MKIELLLDELRKLGLPTNEFAITGSGPLAIRNIREASDLDLIVISDLWEQLSCTYPVVREGDFESIDIGNIQILGNGSWFTDGQFGVVEEQIRNADVIDGFRYVKLEVILAIKRARNHQKDVEDIGLIERFLGLD